MTFSIGFGSDNRTAHDVARLHRSQRRRSIVGRSLSFDGSRIGRGDKPKAIVGSAVSRRGKQDVVFQMNVLVQIGFELNQRSEQRAIGVACLDWDRIVARESSHMRECPTGALVLMLHTSDGVLDAAERHHLAGGRFKFCDGWKQNELLPHHVCIQLFSERAKNLAHLKSAGSRSR